MYSERFKAKIQVKIEHFFESFYKKLKCKKIKFIRIEKISSIIYLKKINIFFQRKLEEIVIYNAYIETKQFFYCNDK